MTNPSTSGRAIPVATFDEDATASNDAIDATVSDRTSQDTLKATLSDPEFVCAALGLADGARSQANGLIVCCPWHPDRTPSCSITIGDDGTVRVVCFGCNKRTDVLGLIAQCAGLDIVSDFPEVLKRARDIALDLGSECATPHSRAPSTVPPALFDQLASAILSVSPLHGAVADYLQHRGLLSAAHEEGWGALPRMPNVVYATAVASVGEAVCEASGLFGTSGEFIYSEHTILIPWRDHDGKIWTFQRRRPSSSSDEPKYVFPRGAGSRAPYGAEHVVKAPMTAPITLVEGAIDVLAYRALARAAGCDPVVLGVPGVSRVATMVLPWAKGRVFRLAFDADDAGDAASAQVASMLAAAGATRMTRTRPLGAKDWAELVERRRA